MDPATTRTWSTIAAVVFAGALALLVADGDLRVFQPDSYKALYDGRWIAAHGVPHVNVLSQVHEGRRWVDVEWLGELFYYEAWRLGGMALVAILAGLSIASGYMIVAALLRRRGLSAGWTMVFASYALVGLIHWDFVRAQDLAIPLFALLLTICLTDSEHARPGRRLLALVPLVGLWGNLHGSVLEGAALAVAYLLWRAVTTARAGSRRLAAGCLGLACLVAVAPMATPYGPGVIHYYLEFVGNPAQRLASSEGRSPAFPGGAFFLAYVPVALVACVAIRAIAARRPAPVVLLGACAITGAAAAARIGDLPWHTIVTALLVAELTTPRLSARRARPLALVGVTVLAGLLGIAIVGSLASRATAGYEADTPLPVTNAVAAAAGRHACWLILADNLDAAALEWHDPWLATRIAFDARAEMYTPSEMMRWAVFESGRSSRWLRTIQGDALLVAAVDFRPALVKRLSRLGGSTVLVGDSLGIAVINHQAASPDGARCS